MYLAPSHYGSALKLKKKKCIWKFKIVREFFSGLQKAFVFIMLLSKTYKMAEMFAL